MEKTYKKQNILWLALFTLSVGLMIWKLPFGFGGEDEGFYLTVAHRLSLGERLFTHEWHLSQLSAFLLYPFVKTYRIVFGGTDGILLASRLLYLLLHALTSAFVYLKLRKISTLSVLGSIFFLLFTPFDMMTLSYNTIALDMLALTAAFAAAAEKKREFAAAGGFFACAVVCCPYLAIVYVLYGIVCLAYSLIFRKTGKAFFAYPLYTGKAFLEFSFGISVIFVLFLAFFFSHSGIKELITALPGLLSDPEHPVYSVIFYLKHYVWCILTSHRLAVVPVGLYLATLAAMLLDRKRGEHSQLYFTASALCTVIWLIIMSSQLRDNYFNGIMLPFSFVGLSSYLLLKNKPRGLFAACFVLGFLYSLCVCSTSNLGFASLGTGYSVINIAGFVFAGLYLREQKVKSRRVLLLICLVPTMLLGLSTIYIKIEHCFWDSAPSALTEKISLGPAKGIVTNEYFKNSYENIYEDMQCYRGKQGGLLVYSPHAWEYLIADSMNYSTFSAWLSGLDETTEERLALYYRMNPEKIPDDIYISKSSAFGELNIPSSKIYEDAQHYGYTVEENEISYKLKLF